MKRIFFSFTFSFLLLCGGVFAAMPVSLFSFFQSYSNLSVIQDIQLHKQFNGNVAAFLTDDANPVSQKLAVMNSLINHNLNNNSAETYKMFIGRIHGVDYQKIDLNTLSGEELLCFGYLTLIDHMGDPVDALPILQKAADRSPQNKSVQFIYALINSQSMINNGKSCEAWKSFQAVAVRTDLINDLDDQISALMTNEMQSFAGACN